MACICEIEKQVPYNDRQGYDPRGRLMATGLDHPMVESLG